MRQLGPGWSHVFSGNVHVTASRVWPVPDFVIVDSDNDLALAAEFKPPGQTKREYLTGLGQTLAYTRDFHYAALIVPSYADDGYRIGEHIVDVLGQGIYDTTPIGVLTYDPSTLSQNDASCTLARPLPLRAQGMPRTPPLDRSFYAKWRDISPGELGRFLDYLYEEGRRTAKERAIRDRAFDRLWEDIIAGETYAWAGNVRSVTDNVRSRTGWGKNFRNFVTHLGWIEADGALTAEGWASLHTAHRYGASSQMFLDHIAATVLLAGKHLVLINAINTCQDDRAPFVSEESWLEALELYLEEEGLLKRNPGRHGAAVKQVARGFLKAEKTLWKNLELIVPRGGRVYYPGRGFRFDWERITGLLA